MWDNCPHHQLSPYSATDCVRAQTLFASKEIGNFFKKTFLYFTLQSKGKRTKINVPYLSSIRWWSWLGLLWPIHTLQVCLLSFNGNKGTGHSVSTLSSGCPLHCPCIVPCLALKKNRAFTILDNQLFLANLPKLKSWHVVFFFPFIPPYPFLLVFPPTLHAVLFGFCFCFPKKD